MRTSLTSLDNRALASLQVEGPLPCIEPIVSVLDTLSPNLTIHASINESSLFAVQIWRAHQSIDEWQILSITLMRGVAACAISFLSQRVNPRSMFERAELGWIGLSDRYR